MLAEVFSLCQQLHVFKYRLTIQRKFIRPAECNLIGVKHTVHRPAYWECAAVKLKVMLTHEENANKAMNDAEALHTLLLLTVM